MPHTVSVIIPVFNRPEDIVQAVRSAWEQTLKPFEIICVDDASTDGKTPDVLKKLEKDYPGVVRCVFLKNNGGPSAARNAGIKSAQGDFIALLDSDDLWLPEKLERQLAFLMKQPNPRTTICLCDYDALPKTDMYTPTQYWRPSRNKDLNTAILLGGVYNMGTTMLAHRDVFFGNSHFFDERLRVGEDYDWLIGHIAQGGHCLSVPETLSRYSLEPEKVYEKHRENLHHIARKWARVFLKRGNIRAYRLFTSGIHDHLCNLERRQHHYLSAAKHLLGLSVTPLRLATKVLRFFTRRLTPSGGTSPQLYL